MRLVAGDKLNHLARCVVLPTMTPAADSLFPEVNVYDGEPGIVAKFSSAAADSVTSADLNLFVNGDFNASPLTGWIALAGTLTREGTIAKSDGSGKLTHTAAAEMYQDVVCRSGERMEFMWSIYGGGGSVAASVRVLNKHTGRYLQVDGSWAASAVDLDSQTTAAWKDGVKQFVVESVSETLRDLTTLRFIGRLSASGTVYFDDWFLYPATDLLAVVEHNVGKILVPEFRSGIAGATLHATLVPRRRSFFALLAAPVYQRYVRLKLAGTPYEASKLGELIFAQTVNLARAPLFPLRSDGRLRQIRNQTPGGQEFRMRLASEEQREISMQFRWASEEEYLGLRDQLFRASGGGVTPCILIPEQPQEGEAPWGDDSEDIFYGRIEEVLGNNSETRTEGPDGMIEIVRTSEVKFLEAAFAR